MNNEHRYLLDASSLVNILPSISIQKIITLEKISFCLTELTPYEIGNALWKLSNRSVLEKEEAITLITLIQELIDYKAIKLIHVRNYRDIMNTALKRKITFYDATYIETAKKNNLILVTDDEGMRANAEIEGVKAIDSDKLRKKHLEIFI